MAKAQAPSPLFLLSFSPIFKHSVSGSFMGKTQPRMPKTHLLLPPPWSHFVAESSRTAIFFSFSFWVAKKRDKKNRALENRGFPMNRWEKTELFLVGFSSLWFFDVSVMVRSFPTDENPLIHPAISFSLLAAGMAAAIAMITTLCGVRSRRRSGSDDQSTSPAAGENKADENGSPLTDPTADGENDGDQNEQLNKDLPLPPKMQAAANSSPPSQIAKSASERKISNMRSMSIKVPRSLSVVRNHLDEGRQRRKERIKGEDSIWTKTIILGEKCKVPDEEDGVIYEGKGKKISAYHPRAQSSMSITISRQGSAIDPETLPNPEPK